MPDPTTKNHIRIKRQVMTHPTMFSGLSEKALATAKVAVVNAVFGKMKEFQVIEKGFLWRNTDQCAPTAMKKKMSANLMEK